jgi:hypothetical protein
MSQIRFVSQLGDALDVVIAAERPARQLPRLRMLRPRLRMPRGRARFVAVLGALVLTGGIATAATLLSENSATLAAQGLSCLGTRVDAYNVHEGTLTPEQACSQQLSVPASKLIACASSKTGVVVYISDQQTDQCQAEHDAALPVNYAAGSARVNTLELALGRVYSQSDCVAPSALVRGDDAVLKRLGFTGWHAELDTQFSGPRSAGPCGVYPGSGAAASDPAAALDASSHTVMVESGPSQSLRQLMAKTANRLFEASGGRCYTLATVQREVHQVLNSTAGDSVPVRFASTQEPPRVKAMKARQRFYNEGCAIIVGFGTAPDGAMLVQLEDRKSPPASSSDALPGSAYQPVLKSN